jgi:hypothetical protein
MQASYAAGLLLAGLGRSALIDPLAGAPLTRASSSRTRREGRPDHARIDGYMYPTSCRALV